MTTAARTALVVALVLGAFSCGDDDAQSSTLGSLFRHDYAAGDDWAGDFGDAGDHAHSFDRAGVGRPVTTIASDTPVHQRPTPSPVPARRS